jgi:hypothetical protein
VAYDAAQQALAAARRQGRWFGGRRVVHRAAVFDRQTLIGVPLKRGVRPHLERERATFTVSGAHCG